jgi:hypothetical protein
VLNNPQITMINFMNPQFSGSLLDRNACYSAASQAAAAHIGGPASPEQITGLLRPCVRSLVRAQTGSPDNIQVRA